jgi:hypothetical protein
MQNSNALMRREQGRLRKAALEAVDALEYVGCQFFACPGPEKRPVAMATCCRCRTLRHLRAALGVPLKKETRRAGLAR